MREGEGREEREKGREREENMIVVSGPKMDKKKMGKGMRENMKQDG